VAAENQPWERHFTIRKEATSGQIYIGQDITKLGNAELKTKKEIQIIFRSLLFLESKDSCR
jgi:hypothetical protein